METTRRELVGGLPIIDIQTNDDVTSHPALAAFAELKPRFTVVIDGAVYRVTLPAAKP